MIPASLKSQEAGKGSTKCCAEGTYKHNHDDELGFAAIFLQSILVYRIGVLVEATFLHDGDIMH